MKLQSFLLTALAGIATASNTNEESQQAEVYIIKFEGPPNRPKPKSQPPSSVSNEVAQAIILQRLSTPEESVPLGQLPDSIPLDESLRYINRFGKLLRPVLWSPESWPEPRQLVVAFTGVTPDNYNDIKTAVSDVPLAVSAPGLSRLPIEAKKTSCTFEQFLNLQPGGVDAGKCWNGPVQYLEYDVTKNSDAVTELGRNLKSLKTLAQELQLDTTIVFFAPADANSLDSESELRRRSDEKETEKVIAPNAEVTHIPTADASFNPSNDLTGKPFHAFAAGGVSPSKKTKLLPTCFSSLNACTNATNSCSGHGQCVDKWAKIGSPDKSCFFCHCMATNETNARGHTGVYHWGGSMCHKRDVSTPFWLFAAVSITLVATVTFAIGLLFSVGEEKLPGVIGAGVSRSK